jgi:hypothetical protein
VRQGEIIAELVSRGVDLERALTIEPQERLERDLRAFIEALGEERIEQLKLAKNLSANNRTFEEGRAAFESSMLAPWRRAALPTGGDDIAGLPSLDYLIGIGWERICLGAQQFKASGSRTTPQLLNEFIGSDERVMRAFKYMYDYNFERKLDKMGHFQEIQALDIMLDGFYREGLVAALASVLVSWRSDAKWEDYITSTVIKDLGEFIYWCEKTPSSTSEDPYDDNRSGPISYTF